MELPARAALALALVALVAALASLRARSRARPFAPRLARLPRDARPPGRAPLVAMVITSRLCGACAETPALVRAVAPRLPLVALGVEERPDLARALGLRETPTLLLVDAEGRIRYAREGNPAPDELAAVLAAEGHLPRAPLVPT